MPNIQYFLGANSPQGFYSLYDQLTDPDRARAIYILKGGPGCGKSTLMSRVALQAREQGHAVERIHCSGDPDSLDGVALPELGVALVDGTAPHVVEPKYPGAVEHYVNLGACYDAQALAPLLPQMKACMQGYKGIYQQAYRALSAAAQLTEDSRLTLLTDEAVARLQKRAQGIVRRECGQKKATEPGRVRQYFLSAVTHRGVLTHYDTALSQCSRIYALCDRYRTAHILLSQLLSGFVRAGHDVVVCPDPMFPTQAEHLLVPGLSLAFLSTPGNSPFGLKPYRRIRLDAMLDPELLRRSRPRLRFAQRVARSLIGDAVADLGRAKAMHDELEAIYNPHVDFDRVNAIADALIKKIM